MPKPTFYNLPEEKKGKLIAAARLEFSNVPLAEASIANIVKAAGIPRGSFYQYFTDKEDLYLFLLEEMMTKRKNELEEILRASGGDLFAGMLEFFKMNLSREEDLSGFGRNVFLNMTDKAETTFARILINEDKKEAVRKIEALIDVSKLNVADEEELTHLLKIIFAVTMRNQVERLSKNLSEEQAIANYSLELELLKRGLER